MSSHCLEIEKGRHVKPKIPEEQRLCKLCKDGSIENEIHSLLHCNAFIEERVKFFTQVLQTDSDCLCDDSTESFINIMKSKNVKVMFHVCKFLCKMFKGRENFL